MQTIGVEPDLEFTQQLMARQIDVRYKEDEENGLLQGFLISWLPMIVLLLVFFFFMRQIQAGGGKAMSFGKSRARLVSDHSKKAAPSPSRSKPATRATVHARSSRPQRTDEHVHPEHAPR